MSKIINRHSSGIWNYFQKQDIVLGDQKQQKISGRVQCLLCQEKGIVHVYKPKTSSGNLWRHLHRSHGVPLPENAAVVTAASANGQAIASVPISATSTPLKSICSWNGETFGDETTFFGEELEERTEISANGVNVSYKVDVGSVLIAEVAKRPALYECNSKINIKKAKRDELWNEVYEALDKVMDVNRLQKMWKNIRDRYKKLRHMDQAKLTDVGSRYKYYDQLKFLDFTIVEQQQQQQQQHHHNPLQQHHQQQHHHQTVTPVETTTATTTYIDMQTMQAQTAVQQQQITRNAIDIKIDPDFRNAVTGTIEFTDSLAVADGNDGELPTKRMKFCNEILANPSPSMQTEQHVAFGNDFAIATHEIGDNHVGQSNELTSTKKDDCSISLSQPDEFDLFGRLIAEKLRKMETPRVNEIEIKILQLLHSEERYTVIQ